MGTENERESIGTPLDWVAFKQQFFSSAVIAPKGIDSRCSIYNTERWFGLYQELCRIAHLPLTPTTDGYSLALYYGPNRYSTLQSINDLGYGDLRMQELVTTWLGYLWLGQ